MYLKNMTNINGKCMRDRFNTHPLPILKQLLPILKTLAADSHLLGEEEL